MKKLLAMLLVLGGCNSMLINDSWRVDVNSLDYARLFQAAYKLVKNDERENIEGLDIISDTIGYDVTHKVLTWYDAVRLALSTALHLRNGIKSRDIREAEVLRIYREG